MKNYFLKVSVLFVGLLLASTSGYAMDDPQDAEMPFISRLPSPLKSLLNSCLDSTEEASHKQIRVVIWKLYLALSNKEVNVVGQMVIRADVEELNAHPRSGNYPSPLDNLIVTIPLKEIIRTYGTYGILQLRPIGDYKKLLLGCGNNPILGYEEGHHHKETITINPQLSKNPTIVGFFGVHDLTPIIPHQHFEILIDEVCNEIEVTEFHLDEIIKKTLTDDHKFFSVKKENNIPQVDEKGYDILVENVEPAFKKLSGVRDYDPWGAL